MTIIPAAMITADIDKPRLSADGFEVLPESHGAFVKARVINGPLDGSVLPGSPRALAGLWVLDGQQTRSAMTIGVAE